MNKKVGKYGCGKFTDLMLFIVSAELIGALSSIASGGGFSTYYGELIKPPFAPPGWVFPVVWALLYALMGLSAFLIDDTCDREKSGALKVYYVQLFTNFLWSPVFFRLRSFPAATVLGFILAGMVLIMMIKFWRIRRSAALINIPYLLWSVFAAVLTVAVWLKN